MAIDSEGVGLMLVRPIQNVDESDAAYGLRLAHSNGLRKANWLMQRCGVRLTGRLKICPCCLASGINYWPIQWESEKHLWCPEHGVWLVDLCLTCNAPLTWSTCQFKYCRCGCTLETFSSQAIPSSLFLLLNSEPRVVPTLTWFGAIALYGLINKPLKRASTQEMNAIASVVEAGWSIYSNWPDSFMDTLRRIRVSPSSDGTIQSFREAFPRFTRILESLKDQVWRERVFACVSAFVADSQRTLHPIHGREPFLASLPNQAAIARSLKISSTTLDGMLTRRTDLQHSKRIMPSGRTRRLISDNTVEDLRNHLSDRMSEKALTQMLGLKSQRIRLLVHSGYLFANEGWFSLEQISEFVREISLTAISGDSIQGTWMPLSEVLRSSIPMRLTGGFFEAVRLGTIGHSSSGSLIDFRAILINVGQLNQWRSLALNDSQEWFSIPDAARQLGLKEQVAYELVANGLLKFKKRVVKDRLTRAISAKSIFTFAKEYVALSYLTKDKNINPKKAYTWALSTGLSVVSGPVIDGSRQYFVKI